MKKIMICALLTAALLASLTGARGLESPYTDVPPEHWSAADVEKAGRYGLMTGYGNGAFGLGDSLNRASFVTILSRMFAWEEVVPANATYSDCQPGAWYYSAVETARVLGVAEAGASFRPEEAITRAEMAVMLVKALGYDTLAASAAGYTGPFADVTEYRGYITLAYDIGMTNGVVRTDGRRVFQPQAAASREEAAAMLVRVYERYHAGLTWLHGFYAFSSYGQIGLTKEMQAVSVGWARMSVSPETGPWLNSTTAGGNEWTIPTGAALATDYFRGNKIPYNLSVYASVWDPVTLADGTVSNAMAQILSTEQTRAQAVQALVNASGDYAGITVDFEGLGSGLKEPFVTFMTELRRQLPADKTLYACVMPDNWFAGYDYRALGELCDKVILMAHDYQWSSIPAYYVGTTRTDCPVTPFPEIYRALRAVTDSETGVQDRSKLALAISIASTGFQVDGEGRLLNQTFYNPGPTTLIGRLRQTDSSRFYSEEYRNPYIYYTAEDGSRYRVWYEDEQSVADKIQLAELFGVTGVSLWRLGNVPDYSDVGLHYNVWERILSLR